ncbi:MAG: DUF1566 domain-containing protein [Nannocystaceae bacterium]|nr:DUF1566 domain-containing protein [Nannocystaceae bacterium]
MDTVNRPPQGPAVVLCCTRDARHLLAPVLEMLTRRGLPTEVVSGLEQRDDTLLATAQRRSDAVFILFADADPQVVARAASRLQQAGVPSQRVIAMPTDWRGPVDVAMALEIIGVPMSSLPEMRRAAPTGTMVIPAPGVAAGESRRQPLHSTSVPVLDVGSDIAEPATHRRRRRAVAAAIGGALALAVVIVAAASGDPEPQPAPAVTSASAGPSPVDRLVSAWRGPAAPESSPVVVALPVPTPPPAAPQPLPVAAPAAIAPPPVVAPVAAAPAAVAPIVVEPEEAVAPELDEDEMKAIYAGLTAQKFRALDIVLVSPEPRKKVRKRITKSPARMSWTAAFAYCDALEIAGVGDWRLPRVGELGSLTKGALVADGKYWSQTEGDTFGRSRVVWNTQTEKMGTAPVAWKGGRVVCVRTMARAPEATPAQ